MIWIISLIAGGIIGWLASIVIKTNAQVGFIANVLVGVVGSMLKVWDRRIAWHHATGGILRFVFELAVLLLLIFIMGKLGFFKKTYHQAVLRVAQPFAQTNPLRP